MRLAALALVAGCASPARSPEKATPAKSPPAKSPETVALTPAPDTEVDAPKTLEEWREPRRGTEAADVSSGLDDPPGAPPQVRLPQISYFENPEIRGSLELTVLRKHLREHTVTLMTCYARELAGKPTLAGTVTVDFVITASGSVATATATGMPKVDACIADEVKKIRFARPPDGVSVQVIWPLKLSTR